MGPIKEALTFDDVTLAPKYSSVLPSDVQTETSLTSNLQPVSYTHLTLPTNA